MITNTTRHEIYNLESNPEYAPAMERLLFELRHGVESAEKNGWISEYEIRKHFRNRKTLLKKNQSN